MKTIFYTLTIIACAAGTLQAQVNAGAASATPNTAWFSAEGSNYFINTGFPANTGIAWYSEQWGGRQLKTSTADGQGTLRLQAPATFHPAFAISQPERGGTGTVVFMAAPEFTLDKIDIHTAAGSISIDWSANVTPGIPILFEVLKAAPDGTASVAGSYRPALPGSTEHFSFSEPSAASPGAYSLRVRNMQAGERYLARLQAPGNAGGALTVYPTVVTNEVTINGGKAAAPYIVTSTEGKVVMRGALQGRCETLSLSSLAPGNYLITAGGASVKVVKK